MATEEDLSSVMIHAMVIFLVCLILYTYFGYPLLLLTFSAFSKSRRGKFDEPKQWPSVTLMIAAYNEERKIAEKLGNCLLLDYPKEQLKIVVVSDGSTDNTDEIVKSFVAKGIELVRVEGRVGKTEARNVAMRSCKTDITVFSDATTHYEPGNIKALVRPLLIKEIGMTTGQLRYASSESATGFGQQLFWKYENLIKSAQSSLHSLTGSVGCITAFETALYHPLPPNIIEDFTEPLMILMKGKKVKYCPDAIAYEEPSVSTESEFRMRVRVIRGGMTGMHFARRILNPITYPLVSFQLISHKMLRWAIPLQIILLLVFSSIGLLINDSIVTLLAFSSICFVLFLGLVGKLFELMKLKGIFIFTIPLYFLTVNFASLKAFFLMISTELEPTWETDRS